MKILKIIFLMMFMFIVPQLVIALDTDRDGVINSIDLDDDNDGILDKVECSINDLNLELTATGYGRGLMECVYHGCTAQTLDGYVVYGQQLGPNIEDILTPMTITRANGYNYTGDILLTTIGGDDSYSQLFVLSTDGLFVQGKEGAVLSRTLTSSQLMQQVSMPVGLDPQNVKSLQAGSKGLMILTKDGTVWTEGLDGNYGDGRVRRDKVWHKASITKKVVSVKIAWHTRFAYDEDDRLYTWGTNTYKGDGSDLNATETATVMVNPLPLNVSIVQIALSKNSYFVLGSDGKVYSLGVNNKGQLGIGSKLEQKSWQVVKNSDDTGILTDVEFISGSDNGGIKYPTVSVILKGGQVLSWGANPLYMIGVDNNKEDVMLPKVPKGSEGKVAHYIENGGHLTPFTTEGKYCNVGHNYRGGFGDGTTTDRSIYTCSAMTVEFLSLTVLPNCDVDGDGIVNSLDLDSDNDGIPDNVEAQTTQSYLAASGNVDVNGTYSVIYGLDGIVPIDTDDDNISDMFDSDSDDDNITDCKENNDAISSCEVNASIVGINGLASWAESSDDYNDTNGLAYENISKIFTLDDSDDDILENGTDANATTKDLDYRDVDRTAPTIIITTVISLDSGLVEVNGTTESNAMVTVTFDNNETVMVQADVNGTYSVISTTAQPTDGNVTAVATDESANTTVTPVRGDYELPPLDEAIPITVVESSPTNVDRDTDITRDEDAISEDGEVNSSLLDDVISDIAIGEVVTISVFNNDELSEYDRETLQIIGTNNMGDSLVIEGEGTWSITSEYDIVFTPQIGFENDPSDISYSLENNYGERVDTARITVNYESLIRTDRRIADLSQPITIEVLENDNGDLNVSSVRIELPESFIERYPSTMLSDDGRQLIVPGEGTWSVNADGTITYIAEEGSLIVEPTPISYSVATMDGTRLETNETITLNQSVVADVSDTVEVCEDIEEKSIPLYGNWSLLFIILLSSLLGMSSLRSDKF